SVDEDLDAFAAIVGDVEERAPSAAANRLEHLVNHADPRYATETPREPEPEAEHPDRHRDIRAHPPGPLVGDPNTDPARAIAWRPELFRDPPTAITVAPPHIPPALATPDCHQQLGCLGGSDFPLLEQLEDPQALRLRAAFGPRLRGHF